MSAGPAEIVLVAGARPNFVKVAPILRQLQATQCRTRLVHTGQHYDYQMSQVFFDQLGITAPDTHLNVGSGSHGAQTGRLLEAFESYLMLMTPSPRGVVVVGDVNSTLACALATIKLGIPVAHVEAGLRAFDRSMPEEINRVVADAICDILFVSEPSGSENLRNEGVPMARIRSVGNVMIDTLVQQLPEVRRSGFCRSLGLVHRGFAVVTLHRPSNVDVAETLAKNVELILELAERLPVVFPMHPRTRECFMRFGLFASLQGCASVRLLDPLGYRETVALLDSATLVLTDSGGIQEETSFLHTPCLTLRRNTERPVTVTHGTNTVIGDNFDLGRKLFAEITEGGYKAGGDIPGWDGCAAERVVSNLISEWGSN
jgi:UDP-N-acetylglucosamine 2-epimerase (non-hydrolysing)